MNFSDLWPKADPEKGPVMRSYVAARDFHVNTVPEGLSVSRGDHIEFDGTTISYMGRMSICPSFRGAVTAQWVTPLGHAPPVPVEPVRLTAWERLLSDSEDL